jgi:hypothetical protein
MATKLLTLLFTSVLAFPLSTLARAQEAPAQKKAAEEVRWEGTIIRSNPDNSTLDVKKVGSAAEMTVYHTLEFVFGQCGDNRECAERGRRGNNSWGRDNVNRSECQRSDRLNHYDGAVNRLVNGKVTLVCVAANKRDRP